MDLLKAMRLSAAGMRAQGFRMRVVSENLANANSMPADVGAEPYRRKIITFRNVMDRTMGVKRVEVGQIKFDKSAFIREYDPGHPSADKQGYISKPNVKTVIEMMDMKEAQRSYEANLGVVQSVRSMLQKTIELLR